MSTRRRVLRAQNVSRKCLVCGIENDLGLHSRFFELDGGELAAVFTPCEAHQSYPGRLHGGIAAAILDEAIGRAINVLEPGQWGVTAELKLRYRKPVPLDGELTVIGRITRDTRRLFEGSGELLLPDGTVAVEATGRYVKLPLDEITDGSFDERDWLPDTGRLPDGLTT